MKESKQQSEASSTQGSAFVSDAFPLNLHPNYIWIADSGATQHMTMHRNCFSTFENVQSVLIGNGQSMKAFGRGNIDVEMHVGGKWARHYLQDVWFVPEAKKKLSSIPSIVDKGMTSSLENNVCNILRDGEIVAT
ncbi:hypothetical protein JTB14_005058 [Gonioctena quinquepunctata]|nr:hypothetical protein JTB14_005058 [Gonioctena quinquepunctata]